MIDPILAHGIKCHHSDWLSDANANIHEMGLKQSDKQLIAIPDTTDSG